MLMGTITSKGQTTIPREIRDHLNLKPGDKVMYTIEEGRVMLRAKNLHPSVLREILPPSGKALTIEEMNEAIGQAVVEADARTRY